jgi:hypothetical protein
MAKRSKDDRTIVPGMYLDGYIYDDNQGAKDIGENPRLMVAASSDPDHPLNIGSGINTDAWGKQKVAQDFSLYHGMFTYEVPQEYWYEQINGVEQTSFTYATSVDGELNLTSNGVLNDIVVLRTFRSPRYQPNRGHLYSSSLFFPSPNNAGQRDIGLGTSESGVFFRLRGTGSDFSIYAVVRTTIGGSTDDIEEDITANMPEGWSPEKGNIYDIQMQWRGVGNIKFYVGDEVTGASKLVHTINNLNVLDNLSIYNPAMPLAYCSINQGADVVIRSGCVDLTSEGGGVDRGFYGSVGIDNQAGQVAISGFNVPILAVRNLNLDPVSGLINTRDMIALLATAYSDQRSVFRVWATRDETAITLNDQAWVPFRDGLIEYVEYDNPNVVTPMTFDTTKAGLIFTARVDQDQSYATSALFEGRTDIFQAAGDYFIFTMHRETGQAANVGVTYEFAEEI